MFPVAVTADMIDKVKAQLQMQPLRISDIDRALHMGPRFVGAALRQLVAEGGATRTTGGKFRAVEQPATDGAGE